MLLTHTASLARPNQMEDYWFSTSIRVALIRLFGAQLMYLAFQHIVAAGLNP
jgi:hypothetical protein